MRRAAARSVFEVGGAVDGEDAPLDAENGRAQVAPVASEPCSARGLSRSARPFCVRLIALLLVLDLLWLIKEGYQVLDPCAVAISAAARLVESPRLGTGGQEWPALPKIIHQQWKTSVIPAGNFARYEAQFRRLFPEPEYQHMLWTDASARELIERDFAWFLPAYDGYTLNIQRADATRYFVLWRYGGLYADLDYEPLRNFWSALPRDRVALVESPYKINEEVQNSLMSSPKGDPFWNVTFELLFARSGSHQVLSSTGPALMDAAMAAAPHANWVHVLPCENFHRVPLGAEGGGPWFQTIVRAALAYSPAVKTCGDCSRRDECHYGIHHNAVSYLKLSSVLNYFTR